MANLTIDQYISKLRQQQAELRGTRAVFIAASTAHADQVERIFTDGNAVSESIGNYNDSDPIYIDPADSPRAVTPKGKSGNKVFKNGKPHKTAFFSSYQEFRKAVSRESSFVNLDLTGRLKSEYENSLQRQDNFNFESRLRTDLSEQKAIGNQRRFGKVIFGASDKERDTFRETMRFEINRVLNA